MKRYAPKKAEFREWLRSKRPNTSVGLAMRISQCPIAKFLKSQPDIASATVDTYQIDVKLVSGALRSYRTPKWAVEFIGGVDQFSGLPNTISAKRALEVLEARNG